MKAPSPKAPSSPESEQLKHLFNLSLDLLCIANSEGYFIKVSPSFERVLGYQQAEGQHYSYFVHPDDKEKGEQAMAILNKKDPLVNFEIRYRHKQGYYLIIAWTIRSENDVLYCIGRDVTRLKELEQARLQAIQERHQQQLQQQADLLNVICHEIRNPLQGIYSTAEVAQTIVNEISQTLVPEPAKVNHLKDLLHNIQLCSEQQRAVLNNTLDAAKLKASKLKLAKQSLNVKEAVQQAVQMMESKAVQKDLKLICHLPEMPLCIKGDKIRLRQIVLNLLSNAIKFTEQGQITVTLSLTQETLAYTYFSLSVQDTGIGMTQEEKEQLFKRFATMQTTPLHVESSGLGLYITKSLVELMNGMIEVETEKGKGTRFICLLRGETLTLEERLHAQFQEADTPKTPPPVIPSESCHVLIVDDNIINQKVLKNLLEKANHTCEIANNGLEALNLMYPTATSTVQPFDIVFMDIKMPVLCGLVTTKRIRQSEKERHIPRVPIIALSGNVQQSDKALALEAGMDDYLIKPFEQNQILVMLEKHVFKKSQEPTAYFPQKTFTL